MIEQAGSPSGGGDAWPPPVVVVLLAAGAGTRFGGQKLLASVGGAPLLWHALEGIASAEAHLDAPFEARILVTGSGARDVEDCYLEWERTRRAGPLRAAPFRLVAARAWSDGLSVSLRAGVDAAWRLSPGAWVAVCLGDQPSIPATHLAALVRARDSALSAGQACAAVGTRYLDRNRNGVPALFSPATRSMLGKLTGDSGARDLLNSAGGILPGAGAIRYVPLATTPFDVDTPEDARRFRGTPNTEV